MATLLVQARSASVQTSSPSGQAKATVAQVGHRNWNWEKKILCRAAALASAAPWPLGSLFGSFSPRGAHSKGDQQPDGHNQKP
jgi:hypothetical protein